MGTFMAVEETQRQVKRRRHLLHLATSSLKSALKFGCCIFSHHLFVAFHNLPIFVFSESSTHISLVLFEIYCFLL